MKTIIQFIIRGIATIVVSIGLCYGTMYLVKLINEWI